MDANEIAKSRVFVKENPATYLVSDAEFTLEHARSAADRKDDDTAVRFARIAILLYAVSLEGFINFVYEYSQVPASTWTNFSLKDKWLRAASECLPCNGVLATELGVVYRPGDPIETFRQNAEPFLSFLELKSFRNGVAHLKPPFEMVKPHEVDLHLSREKYYPASGLPKFLQHCRIEHAETAKRIYQAMTEELDRQMKGTVRKLFEVEGVAFVESIHDGWEDEDTSGSGESLNRK